MSSDHRQRPEDTQAIVESPRKAPGKRPYRRPVLQELGPVVQTTLAPSPGTFESGQGAGFRSPTR
jgi:hypothetical protein